MSDKKVLNINPALFSVSNYNNKTKKKRETNTPAQQIRVKSKEVTKNKERERTLKKRSLLKMIREQQEANYWTRTSHLLMGFAVTIGALSYLIASKFS